jgi:hypothetical protein
LGLLAINLEPFLLAAREDDRFLRNKYMKNFFTKIITVYVIVASLALVLKVGDNMLAKASTSNIADQCGTNNGWIWNSSQCVNVCDQNHPWDSNQQKCSNGYGYYGYNGYGYVPGNSNYMGNCAAYGSNYFWNGSVCLEITQRPNASYNGNPFNGGYTTPVYNSTVNNVYNGYNSYNGYNNNYIGYNDYNYMSYVPANTCNSCNVNPAPKVVTTYYIYTTTTTSVPSYSNYYTNGNYYNNSNNYAYLGNNYGYDNDYWDCDYSDYTNVGYYDIYGNYHF